MNAAVEAAVDVGSQDMAGTGEGSDRETCEDSATWGWRCGMGSGETDDRTRGGRVGLRVGRGVGPTDVGR